jgi:hypothetical protein
LKATPDTVLLNVPVPAVRARVPKPLNPPANVFPPAPLKVRSCPPPTTTPLSANVPVPVKVTAAFARVIESVKALPIVTVPTVLKLIPLKPTFPFRVTSPATTSSVTFSSKLIFPAVPA